MVNYQNGKVYKIINKNNEIIYIGSTAQKLCQRYQTHNHKSPNHKIILIENYPCNSREELRKREQKVIEEHNNLINQIRAYCSEEDKKKRDIEYRNKPTTKEHQKNYHKEYRKDNIEKITEYQKNLDKTEYYNNYNDKMKTDLEYREKRLKQKKNEYEKNKNNTYLKKVKCEFCNCEVVKCGLKRHQRTKKCLEKED